MPPEIVRRQNDDKPALVDPRPIGPVWEFPFWVPRSCDQGAISSPQFLVS